jgi:hypothetical protein
MDRPEPRTHFRTEVAPSQSTPDSARIAEAVGPLAINMPEDSTVEDIMNAYTESWRLGLKAVAIYRDNSKRVQPMSSGAGTDGKKAAATATVEEKIVYRPMRRKLAEVQK